MELMMYYSLDFIENDAGGQVDLVDADSGSYSDQGEHDPVDGQKEDIVVLNTLRLVRGRLLVGLVVLGLGNDDRLDSDDGLLLFSNRR